MEATKGRLRPGGVAFGLAAFAALAALGALAAGWLDGGRLTLAGITRRAPVPLVIAVLGLAVLDYALGGLRLHVWVRRFAPGTPYSVSLRAYLVTLFAGPVSPMSAASGPTQVATLARYGIGPARALAALLLNYIGILTALLTVGGLGGLFLLRGSGLAVSLGGLERSLVAAAVAIPFLLVVALANPRPLHAFALSFGGGGVRLGGRIGSVNGNRRSSEASVSPRSCSSNGPPQLSWWPGRWASRAATGK
ncbi:MAG: flippase-like domain-containing protein [Gemmatimonadetes bacterium]|nr:flippase-like domain-containing protein [Gemmatimonadota bacterium]